MAAAEEAPGGAGQEEGLEGLLGVSEGHDSALLSLRLQRGELVVVVMVTCEHRLLSSFSSSNEVVLPLV